MKIIGITGPSGGGKSTYAKHLLDIMGDKCVHIDIDRVGHFVMDNPDIRAHVEEEFGKGLTRRELGDLVFNDREKYKKLVDITWERMCDVIDGCLKAEEVMDEEDQRTIILDWVLLPKTKYWDMCDVTYYCWADPHPCEYAMKRDNITLEQWKARAQNGPEFDKYKYTYKITFGEKE